MAINKRLFIYATFIISCGAVALTVTAFATKFWVSGEMKPAIVGGNNDAINYGLFSGTLIRRLFSSDQNFNLFITCLMKENICMWTCNGDASKRQEELENLYINGTSPAACTAARSSGVVRRLPPGRGKAELLYRKSDDNKEGEVLDKRYLNAGLRLSTIVFLSLALLFAVTGAVFAVINSAITPIELITGIFGLYIWNGVSLACDALVLILWGAHFAATLSENVAYSEVIFGALISANLVSLGYSYWCVLGAALAHGVNLILLVVRQVLIDKEPVQKTVEMEANDGDIFLY